MTPEKKAPSQIYLFGFFINPVLADIKEKGQEKHKQKILQTIGHFYINPLESYPVKYLNIAEETLCDILFGKYTPNAYYEFGKKSCDRFMNSPFGTTITSFIGKNPEKLFMNVGKLYNIVGQGADITTEKIGENKILVRFHNDPFPLRGIEGLLARGLEHMAVKNGKVKFVNRKGNDHEFIITWDN